MKPKQLHKLSDEEITAFIVKHKDSRPFRILYERYANKVYAKCLSFTKSQAEAEDLAHDIFLKVYLKLRTFKASARFSTWLYSITYHYCVDFVNKVRRDKAHHEAYVSEINAYEEDTHEEEILQIQIEKLKQILEQIKPEDKALLLMKYQDDLPIKDIMVITALSESAVKMRLKRAKAKIIELSRS
ncbi:RNA polymerase sigma factor (sigma-70 family) [Catalinimonas alkaloidigena]|uniref:RNA polymerase sigma factor n=1 Tax=Catalinimonas alkaloidigena TaxID=1075417 RepID=UPI002407422C|nr:sigma-70 family RNA polymerase sigma factor [Catalinimonas alkaloidigena]MDF9798959.1 RNA polymerase sigma factor (sigma-70 family) [Catalinimonas alkaloidigena]